MTVLKDVSCEHNHMHFNIIAKVFHSEGQTPAEDHKCTKIMAFHSSH